MTHFITSPLGFIQELFLFSYQIIFLGIKYAFLDLIARRAYRQGMQQGSIDLKAINCKPGSNVKSNLIFKSSKFSNSFPIIAVLIPCICNSLETLEDLIMTLRSLSLSRYNSGSVIIICIDGPSLYLDDIIRLCKNSILNKYYPTSITSPERRCIRSK